MGFIIYGTKSILLGVDEMLTRCPHCESDTFQEYAVFGYYYHMYYIPVFATDKELHLTCSKCGLQRKGLPLSPKLFSNYHEINREFRHPVYAYTISIIAGSLVLLGVVFSFLGER